MKQFSNRYYYMQLKTPTNRNNIYLEIGNNCNVKLHANEHTFFIPIKLILSSLPIARTASTTMVAKNSFSPPINLEESVVSAHFASKDFFSSRLFPSMLTASSLILLMA